MNRFIIASFLSFSLIFFFVRKRVAHIEEKRENDFWERETRANFVRKKPIDGLNYITIPDGLLNMQPSIMTDDLKSCIRDLNDLSEYKIVNLTGYTNTDLKLEYGTANITILSEFDLHYTNLATLLQKLAELLIENGDDALAKDTLEFAVSTGTDVSKSYYLLADLYVKEGASAKIGSLINSAESLNSLMKNNIIEKLKEY